MTEHRNFTAKHFCPGCEHSHFPVEDAAYGVCVRGPPTPFLLGMTPNPATTLVIAKPAEQQDLVPVIRAYFPTVGVKDTCSQWERRAEGNA